jgi:membrane fusion protein (multidrug efflux system)
VRIRFPQSQLDNAIRVPQRAVQGSALGQTVLTVDAESKVTPSQIKTSTMSGADFIVLEGLKAGDQVIVNGLQKAKPGSVVKPIPWTAGKPLLAPSPAAPKP